MEDSYTRSSSDVRDIIKHAKLHESELTDVTQVLAFPQEDSAFENLKFLQLDQHLLEELTQGGSVVFKGSQSDNAVLCTSSRTYDIKEAETSNSLLLIPGLMWAKETKLNNPDNESMNDISMEENQNKSSDLKSISPDTSLNNFTESDNANRSPRKLVQKDILKVFYTYFEPRLCKPRLEKLNDLLQCTRYSGPEYEYSIDKKLLLTHAQLKDIIQASDKELSEGLDILQAMEIDGFYRILSFEYEFRVVSYMLDLIDENSWEPDKISKRITLETLKDLIPAVVLDNMFDFYTEKGKGDVVESEQLFKYREAKVCRFLAQVLLKSAGKFNLKDFMQAWKDSVPEGMVAEESMLNGIALIDLDCNPQVIWAFHENTLPQNICERFRILFQTKPKWTVPQIAPYIERFTTDKLNVNALLTKYARGSNHNNIRHYSAKHGK